MSETITVRDHSQPCKHLDDCFQSGLPSKPHWFCRQWACPGGKEITLRKLEPSFLSLKELVDGSVWVEVNETDYKESL